jgi:murein DD-endopeptidase MepM/ murein hydrolase activator NlpD
MRDKVHSTRLGRPTKRPVKAARSPSARLFYGIFAALFATNVVTVLVLLMSPDIAALINGQTANVLAAYEERIAQLRLEVDRLHSRQYVRTGDINLQLQELAQQQEILAEQHQYVKALADKAAELGIGPLPGATADKPARTGPVAALPASVTLSTSDAGEAAIEEAGHQMRQMMDESREAMASLSVQATASTDAILASLRQVGIKPNMPATSAAPPGDGIGGPLLPPEDGADSNSMVDEANAVMAALARFKDARAAIGDAPVHMPVSGPERISSTFGNRTDPFTGRQAFHPGIDFPWPTGTTVLAAGEGKVILVGQINGYGNVIDIDHGGGIITRYGHLSSFIAREGDVV